MKFKNQLLAAIGTLAMTWSVAATAEVDETMYLAEIASTYAASQDNCMYVTDPDPAMFLCIYDEMHTASENYFGYADSYMIVYLYMDYWYGPTHPNTIDALRLFDTYYAVAAYLSEWNG